MKSPISGPDLILASQSPRRRDLLKQAGLRFTVIPSSFDENSIKPSSANVFVRLLAEGKAGGISAQYPDSWVIAADTIVYIEDTILGKPGSKMDAREMLQKLSGKTHQVLTGYCICCHSSRRTYSDVVSTDVLFKKLTATEIDWYIDSGEPFDKAGGYAIQGIGTFLVRRINGSYTNVVGLPVCEVMDLLIREKIIALTD